MTRTGEDLEDFHEEMRQDEMRDRQQEARETLKDCYKDEFYSAYSDFDLAKKFVENGDDEMSFDDFVETEFEHYCENRD